MDTGIYKTAIVSTVIALLIGLFLGYWSGDRSGYQRAKLDIQAAQEELANKAAENAAKAANPFASVNPLEGVGVDPLQKAKKALNPFEE